MKKAGRAKWLLLIQFLALVRAKGRCEICHERPDWRGLAGHHIVFRSRGGKDVAGNTIIGCGICHDHDKYPKSGLPISVEEALELVKKLNEENGIDALFDGIL